MADYRLVPKGVKPSKTEGDYFRTIGGVAAWGAADAAPTPLVSVVSGVPGLVFDADGQQVYMKGGS